MKKQTLKFQKKSVEFKLQNLPINNDKTKKVQKIKNI